MRQGWNQRLTVLMLAGVALLVGPMMAHATLRETAPHQRNTRVAANMSQTDAARSKRAANTLRQFTGTVSAIDKQSITVEKRGKAPETRVFTKHDEITMTGDVEKDARVTVYFREEGGKAIAHKVVVKPARASSKTKA